MKFGDRGLEVQEMQEALINRGYPLPRYGIDGDFGTETLKALNDFQDAEGLPPTLKRQAVNRETLEALEWDQPLDCEVPDPPDPHPSVEGVKLYDLRNEPWSERNPKKFKMAGKKPVLHQPENITGITIHQTAAKFGAANYQIVAAGGDEHLALARRSLRVACHVMAFHPGFIAWANPLDWYVYHGNGFNSFELGIEIDGCYPGVRGGKTWNGKKATEVTDSVIKAACAGIQLLVIEGRKMGMPIEFIHAHRQSSATRRDDPGEELWQRVVLDFCVPVLGLKTEPARVLPGRNGDGRPIPRDWDPSGIGKY